SLISVIIPHVMGSNPPQKRGTTPLDVRFCSTNHSAGKIAPLNEVSLYVSINPNCAVCLKVLIPLLAGGCPVSYLLCFPASGACMQHENLFGLPFIKLFGQNECLRRTHQD